MAKLIPSLGFGLLFASYLTMIGRAGATSDQFFFNTSWGIVLGGLIASIATLVVSQHLSPRAHRFAALANLTLGFGCALASSLMRCFVAVPAGQLTAIEGALFGFGCCLMTLAWTDVFAAYHFVQALRRGACALLVGILIQAAAQIGALGFPPPYWCAGLICLSLLCALFELSVPARTTDSDIENRATSHPLPIRTRIASLMKTAWASLCGLGVCAFLLGTLWTQSFPSAGGDPAALGLLDSIGPTLACIGLAIAAQHITNYSQTKRLFWVVMPVTAMIFLITPSLEDLTLTHWNLIVANLQNAGSVCMLFCTWALLLLGARTNSLPVATVFGASLALIGALPLLGACSFALLGNAGNVCTVVMFILYMGAVILFLALGKTDGAEGADGAADFFTAFIATRCTKLSEQGSLTPRESEILVLLGRGHGYAHIAETFYISEATARTHARNIYRKLNITSQEELLGLIDQK